MKKLSECIAFPEKKDRYYDNYRVIFLKIGEKEKGFDQALKECKDAVDKMGLDWEKIENIMLEHADDNSMIWFGDVAQAIADNLPKLLKEIE